MEKYDCLSAATPYRKKITMLFLNTLQDSYYDRLLPSATRDFTDMIRIGELVDHAIKNGKIEANGNIEFKKMSFVKKKRKKKPKQFSREVN